jgi:hypothetical protein
MTSKMCSEPCSVDPLVQSVLIAIRSQTPFVGQVVTHCLAHIQAVGVVIRPGTFPEAGHVSMRIWVSSLAGKE